MQTIIEQVAHVAQEVKEGNVSPLKSYIELKRLEGVLASALKDIQDDARNEAEAYNQKSFEAHGAKIELRNAASRWDYSNCSQVNHLSAKLKTMQELAQLAINSEMYDEDGVRIEAATKIEGKSTIAISLKK